MSTLTLVVNFLVAVALPALVALVTRRMASSGFKAIVLLILAAIAGTLTNITIDNHVNWKTVVLSFGMTFVTAVATHYGLLKPTGVTGSEGSIQTAVPHGLGTSQGDHVGPRGVVGGP